MISFSNRPSYSIHLDITARVSYAASGTLDLPDATLYNDWPDFDDTLLVPLETEIMLPPTAFHRLDAYFDTYDDGSNRASCEYFSGCLASREFIH